MTTIAVVGVNTIMDVVNSYTSLDEKAKYIWAANVLARKCPFFQDMPMKPSNQMFSNLGARVSYLNTPVTRGFNQGVSPTAVHSTPYSEGIAMIEDYGEVDKTLCDIQPNPKQWRQERDAIKLEAMTQTAETLLISGTKATDPNAWDGFRTRFNVSTHYPNGDTTWPVNVKLAGGDGTINDILVVEWGESKVFGIYPANLPAGIQVRDLGEVTAVMSDSPLTTPTFMQAYRTFMSLYFGLNIEDERYVQRLANIEPSGADNIFNPEHLVEIINNLPGGGNDAIIYVPRAIKTQMDIAAMNKANAFYTIDANNDVFGRQVLRFRGLPVRMAEKMGTHTAIS